MRRRFSIDTVPGMQKSPSLASLWDLFARQAAVRPHAAAAIYQGQAITYAALANEAAADSNPGLLWLYSLTISLRS